MRVKNTEREPTRAEPERPPGVPHDLGETYNGGIAKFVQCALFSAKECDQIIALLGRQGRVAGVTWQNEQYGVHEQLRQVMTSYHAKTPETAWIYDRMEEAFLEAAKEFELEITGTVEDLKYLVYSAGDHFNTWHMDGGPRHTGCRKVSMSVDLSPTGSYEGGHLEIFPDAIGSSLAGAQGSAVIFPSIRFHRVTPVTRGVRHALINWISGPPYR